MRLKMENLVELYLNLRPKYCVKKGFIYNQYRTYILLKNKLRKKRINKKDIYGIKKFLFFVGIEEPSGELLNLFLRILESKIR